MLKELNVPEWSSAIFSLRQRLGLSQSDFGSRMHYSAMAVSRWETGKQEPTSRCFIQLGNMAGQPECWLFWARAGLKSSDLRQMFPGTRAIARMTTSVDFEIVRAGSGVKEEATQGRSQTANGRGSTARCAGRHDRADRRPICRF